MQSIDNGHGLATATAPTCCIGSCRLSGRLGSRLSSWLSGVGSCRLGCRLSCRLSSRLGGWLSCVGSCRLGCQGRQLALGLGTGLLRLGSCGLWKGRNNRQRVSMEGHREYRAGAVSLSQQHCEHKGQVYLQTPSCSAAVSAIGHASCPAHNGPDRSQTRHADSGPLKTP